MNLWVEFKNTILPWLLAGGVVTFLVAEHRRTTAWQTEPRLLKWSP